MPAEESLGETMPSLTEQARKRRLAETTLALCAIPSVTGDEDRLAAEVYSRAVALVGAERARRSGNAVVAEGPVVAGRPTVALFGHLDTVRPASEQPLEITDGRVYGCGATDMKGGLAVMLELLGEASTLPGANLRCVFYDREEGPALTSGILPLLEAGVAEGVDLALCLEPTDNRVEAGCVGGVHALLHFGGVRAHSARPWLGRNAIYTALETLGRLRDRPSQEVVIDGLTFYEVMNATTAQTDNSRNVIPDRYTVNVNYRFAPGKPMATAVEELRSIVPAEVDCQVEIVDEAPSGPVRLDHPLLVAWRGRRVLPVAAKQAWTDVARLGALGLAAVNFGPGETALAHQARESVAVESLYAHHVALRDLLLHGAEAQG